MKKTSLILFALMVSLFASAQTIEKTYYFNQPSISQIQGYEQIQFTDCMQSALAGQPSLPWQSVSLMLPQGTEAVNIEVELSDFQTIEGSHNLFPYQTARTYSNPVRRQIEKDEALYASKSVYPAQAYGKLNTQYMNGVGFAFSAFTPVQYVPGTGEVRYATKATVRITTTASKADQSRKLWLSGNNGERVKRLAQNPEMLESYNSRDFVLGGYDLLVVTPQQYVASFDEYVAFYQARGLRVHVTALEAILSSMSGQDDAEKLRNYIIQEYEDNGIMMVNLAGDTQYIPYRCLYCYVTSGGGDQEDYCLPADLYFAALDGNWNDDGDDRWGEVGEDDLLPELGIGRLSFNNEAQFETIMHKTFSYLQNPVLGEFTSPILGAEHLGDGYYGSEDMERLIGENNDFDYTTYGYPEDYNFKRYYATPTMNWNGNAFRNLIGTGGQYVHHVGHANTDVVANWNMGSMGDQFFAGNDGINHNYMLFHSHGCICGDFSHNCILEKMVTISTGFVVTVGNSRYGWYMPWGDGMAAHVHREMVDAYCHDHIPSVGMALREGKIASAPWVAIPIEEGQEENGYLRWNIYCLNVLGDAALCPWFEEPFTPNVVYEQGLMVGAMATIVNVNQYGTPLSNFCVSLFDGETLLGRGITDENGNAELDFGAPLDVVGEMKLIVTGQSAWPQSFEVTGFGSGEAYVYGDIINLSGEAEYGASRFVSMDFYNKGDVSAFNIYPELSSDCEYISVVPGNIIISEIAANGTEHLEQGGLIKIADNIPDQTIFTLDLTAYTDETAHTTHKSFLAKAPNLQFDSYAVDDSQGDQNGFIDPGEHVVMHINGKNIGHALAAGTTLTVTCPDNSIQIEEPTLQIGNVEAGGDFTADLVLTAADDIIGGTVFHLDMAFQTGAYTFRHDLSFAVGIAVETFESGDFSFLDWEHAGDLHWFVTDEEAHNGIYSARSGAIDDDEVTKLFAYADIFDDGEISFWFKTSTEYHKDLFGFFIDGQKMDLWSGENDWTFVSYGFEAGSHVFEWLYDKNGHGVSGSDCVWIDDITFPRTCIVTKIEETTEKKVNNLYPNPAQGSFTLELAEESNIRIFNILGQEVMHQNKVSGIQQIGLENAPKGMYFVQIQNGSETEVKKLIVE